MFDGSSWRAHSLGMLLQLEGGGGMVGSAIEPANTEQFDATKVRAERGIKGGEVLRILRGVCVAAAAAAAAAAIATRRKRLS
jgi:hypothetical protein